MDECELTILMPCLNEAETLAACIQKAKDFLQREKIQGEILIADNGSHDGSLQLARELQARTISVEKKGYGAALKKGIAEARGKYIIMGDADDSYHFNDLTPFLEYLRAGCDLVMGNRFQGKIMQGAMPFLNRYLGNPVLSFLGRLFCHSSIGDFHCGLRGFKRDSILQLNLQGDGMEFASEMIVKAALKNLSTAEVPIVLYPDGRSRKPHLRPFRDGWRHLRLLLLFCPRWLFFYPGIFLSFLGLLLFTLLIFKPVAVGKIIFDIHTLLFGGLFLILGFQAICFALFSRWILYKRLKLPFDSLFLRLMSRYFSLEKSLLLGTLFIFSGSFAAFYGFLIWYEQSFGVLAPSAMMRILIPAVTAIILGAQIIFASFFMSLLGFED